MTDDAVTPFPGVTRRKDANTYQFALKAPKDLQHRFTGKPWAVRCSLGTADLRAANERAKALQAEWSAKFAAMRREDNAQPAERITPEMARVLAQRVAAAVLRGDEQVRQHPRAAQGFVALGEAIKHASLAPLRIRPPQPMPTLPGHLTAELDPWEGLPHELAADLQELNQGMDGVAADALRRGHPRLVEERAKAEARALGFTFERSTPGALEAMRECLEAYREAWAAVRRRDAGDVVPTPEAPTLQAQPQEVPGAPIAARQGHTPLDAFEAWESGKPGRPRKSVESFRAAATKLAELLPGKPLEALTREDGRAVTATLLKEAQARGGAAQNTAVKLLSRFKTLLNVAVDLEWIDRSPLQGRTIERVKTVRRPWKPRDLAALFDDPLFTAYALPSASMAGADAAYWLPLLGLFTGARISELAQLGVDDLKHTADAGWVLSIHEEGEGQSVKNQHSIRTVPIHPELIRLGLIDYQQAVKDAGAARLWPAVIFTELNGAGGKVSQWFSKYKTGKGFGPELVFHSFRHTLETELRALSVPKYHIAALAGHAGEDVSDDYAHPTPAVLRPHLERLQFPGLALSRVFKAPGWKPASKHLS